MKIIINKCIYIIYSAVKFQISNLFFSVRFKSLIFGYLKDLMVSNLNFKFSLVRVSCQVIVRVTIDRLT